MDHRGMSSSFHHIKVKFEQKCDDDPTGKFGPVSFGSKFIADTRALIRVRPYMSRGGSPLYYKGTNLVA